MKSGFLLAALACVGAVASESSISTMPLFSWSGHSDMESKPTSADAALETALTGQPELVMVYMLNEVSTVDMQTQKDSFANLQAALDQAHSSSFAALPVSKVDIDSLLATSKAHGITGADVESSQLEAYLASHSDLMSNQKPDVVVVRFPEQMDAADTDRVLGTAEKSIAAATSGKYSSILSTTSSMAPGVATNLAFRWFASDYLRSNSFNTLANFNGTAKSWPKSTRTSMYYGGAAYMTPTLGLAILVMIYMAFLALSAYCCILNLQTPEKFEGDQEKDMSRALNQGEK